MKTVILMFALTVMSSIAFANPTRAIEGEKLVAGCTLVPFGGSLADFPEPSIVQDRDGQSYIKWTGGWAAMLVSYDKIQNGHAGDAVVTATRSVILLDLPDLGLNFVCELE